MKRLNIFLNSGGMDVVLKVELSKTLADNSAIGTLSPEKTAPPGPFLIVKSLSGVQRKTRT